MDDGLCAGLLRFPDSEGPDGEEPDRAAPPLQESQDLCRA